MKKDKFKPPLDPFCPQFGGGGSSATSPLKICHYLKALLEQNTENL